jgi:putative hydrolase of the HAD superfamily
MHSIKVIAFDADDTLWVNEPFFREYEADFATLVSNYASKEESEAALYKRFVKNLPLYGYGLKSFTLSLIETLGELTDGQADYALVKKTLELGQEILRKPVEVLDGVEEVLKKLNGDYRLVMATKGDLLDQERKLQRSGLAHYFHHIEVMSDKKSGDYDKLLKRLDCQPAEFLMVGNSMKSDVLPVLEIGGWAVHVPFHTTWEHEMVEVEINNDKFLEAENISGFLKILR